MSSVKERALIEAPVSAVWALLDDPARYSEWNEDTIAVTGAPTKIERGSSFKMTTRSRFGRTPTTRFVVEELDDLHEIKLRCQTSGFYSHWLLTEARGQTFAQLELGVEPVPGLTGMLTGAMHTKSYLRRSAETAVTGLRRALERTTD